MLVAGDPAFGHGGTPSQEAEDAEWYLRPAAEQCWCTDRGEDIVHFMDAQAGPALARWSPEEQSLGWKHTSEPLMFGQNAELDLSQSGRESPQTLECGSMALGPEGPFSAYARARFPGTGLESLSSPWAQAHLALVG